MASVHSAHLQARVRQTDRRVALRIDQDAPPTLWLLGGSRAPHWTAQSTAAGRSRTKMSRCRVAVSLPTCAGHTGGVQESSYSKLRVIRSAWSCAHPSYGGFPSPTSGQGPGVLLPSHQCCRPCDGATAEATAHGTGVRPCGTRHSTTERGSSSAPPWGGIYTAVGVECSDARPALVGADHRHLRLGVTVSGAPKLNDGAVVVNATPVGVQKVGPELIEVP